MKSHAFHDEARVEFVAEIRFYEDARAGWGRRFHDAVMSAVRRACAFPAAVAVTPDGVRKLVTAGFPFVVFYELLDDRIVIWAVMHGARRPGYWKHRRLSPL